MNRQTITINGVRYYADRPKYRKGCFFWENNKKGYRLKKENSPPESLKQRPSNTDNSYTEMSDTDPIHPGSERMVLKGITERYFKSVLEYDALLLDYNG